MLVAVLSGFAVALVAPWLQRRARGATGWILALLPLGLVVYFASAAGRVAAGVPLRESHAWAPALGIALSFSLDGLSLLFALLIAGMGGLVLVYAGGYLAGHPQLGRFYAVLLMFMGSMLGVVLADNLLALFVFWELTSITSFLLIGFEHEREAARASALQALLVTGGGGLALLAGAILLGQAGGTLELSGLVGAADAVRAHALYLPIVLLVFAAAFTKSAQVPFHFWLPGAMEAPTPVSAYLHSATMVKAGIYLLARVQPILGGTPVWHEVLTPVGAATMLVGAWLALRQTDMKLILAYTTVSALGSLTLLIGVGTDLALTAMVVYLVGHALYKGALFLVAGAVDHEAGTRDTTRLSGLARAMPITATAAGLAALSMAGLPPFFGFIGKELVYESSLAAPTAALIAAAVVANVLYAAAGATAGLSPFLGRTARAPHAPHEAPVALWLGPTLLAGLGVVIGLTPGTGVEPLVRSAVAAVAGRPVAVTLALWHGVNLALALSALTVAGAIAIYLARDRWRAAANRIDLSARFGPARGYVAGLRGLLGLAAGQTRVLQNGNLRHYLSVTVLTAVGLTAAALARWGGVQWPALGAELTFYEAGLALLIALAAVGAATARERFAAVASLGVVGYGMALVFLLFGAPDLAITQVVIETLTVILFVLVLYHMPEVTRRSSPRTVVRDVALATVAGALVTVLLIVAIGTDVPPTLRDYFAAQSVPGGHGRNIVNVILVDFRALDTLGEITVLALAALGVYALLRLRPPDEDR